jgi:hypothetical protein
MNRKIKGTAPEPPLSLDMPFDEALRRFISTKPDELEASIKPSKKKPPDGKKKRMSGGV